jgi:hypothetical protein
MDQAMTDRLLTPADVSALCGCSVRLAFKKMRKAGAVPFGGSLRITRGKFLQWLDDAEAAGVVRERLAAGFPARRREVVPRGPDSGKASPPLPPIHVTQAKWKPKTTGSR